MPVEDHPIHERVRHGADSKYGCWNLPRPVYGQLVAPRIGRPWPYTFSTECRYDKSLTDAWCDGCEHRGSGEIYAERVARSGT